MLMRWLKKTAAQAENLPAVAAESVACELPYAGGHVLKPATLESLKRMRRSGGAASVVELVQSYRNGAPARVAAMKRALQTGNSEGLRLAARAMQWTSLNIGASDLSERCASLAQAVEDRGIDPQCDHWSLQWIESLLGRVLVALDTELLDKAA